MPKFDYAGAKKAGYSDDNIASFLQQQNAQGKGLYIDKGEYQQVTQPTGKQQRLALASPGANPFQPVPEATDAQRAADNPMFKGGVIASAASALNSSLDRQDAGQQGPVQTGIQTGYHTAVQPAVDTIGKIFSPITKATNTILNGGVGSFVNAITGKGFHGNDTPDPFQYIQDPGHRDTAESIFNTGQAALMLKGGTNPEGAQQVFSKGVEKAAPDVIKKPITKAVDAPAQAPQNMLDSMTAKQAAKIDEQLGLQKNTKQAIGQRQMSAATGAKTPGQVLTENNIPFDNSAPQALGEHIAVRAAAKQALLESEGKYASFDDIVKQAKDNLSMKGQDLNKARSIIDEEAQAYKQQYAKRGFKSKDGNLMLPLDAIDEIKSELWKQSYKKGITLPDQLTSQAKAQFGNAAKTAIENTTGNDLVQHLNREEGDFINAQKMIADKNINQMKAPGKVATGVRKIIGGVVGSHAGIPGAIAGAEIADYAGQVLDKVPDLLRQRIISKLKSTPEGQSVLSKVQDILKQRAAERASQKALPGQTTIFAGPGPDASRLQVLDPETTVQRNPKTGRMFRVYKSTPKQ